MALRVSFTTSGTLGKSALRQANERIVLNTIRRQPGISRADIARVTGFARTSATFVVNRLVSAGLVREERAENGAAGAAAGRPPTALRIVPEARLVVGAEIGQPESRVVLADLEGHTLSSLHVAWNKDPAVHLAEVRAAMKRIAGPRHFRRVVGAGVSLPGTIDKSAGVVTAAESLGWFNVDAGRQIGDGLPWPVFFENDANLAALAERWFGGRPAESLRYFVFVRAEGGLGTGVVVDGHLLHGVSSASAEFGHVMLYPDGRRCNCGNRGCWEQYASSAALVRNFRAAGGRVPGNTGGLAAALHVVRLAQQGHTPALAALRETAHALALGFANLVAALNPQAIVVGEPFASAWHLIEDQVNKVVSRRIPPYQLTTVSLMPSRLGADAALRGAVALALAHFFTRFDDRASIDTRG